MTNIPSATPISPATAWTVARACTELLKPEERPGRKCSQNERIIQATTGTALSTTATVCTQRCAPYRLDLASTTPTVSRTNLSLIHISEPTRLGMISYAVFCLKKKKK